MSSEYELMKIDDLNENFELDELNLGLTRKGREIKRANKVAKGDIKDEIRQMEVELAVWMKQSGIKRLTADDLQNYFGQKGLGDTARPIIIGFATKSGKKTAKTAAARSSAGLTRQQPPPLATPKPATAPAFKSNRRPNLKVVNSMYEAEGADALTRREVRTIVQQVIRAAYKGSAGFGQSRFAAKKTK